VVEQVSEVLVGEQGVALAVQERVDRGLVEHLVQEAVDIVEEVALPVSQPEAHQSVQRKEDPMAVILSHRAADREHLRSRRTPTT
jgi:hypothetical protein